MIKPGDRIVITAPRLEEYHGQEFLVTWVGTYAKDYQNPVAHFYVKPEESNVERKRGSFAFSGEYEKVA